MSPEAEKSRFVEAYRSLSEDGWCDGYGGMESRRVYRKWVEAGQPENVEAFISERANIAP